MKIISQLWWLLAVVTLIIYFFYRGAIDDLHRFNNDNSGWNAFAGGFVHGLIGDFDYPARTEDADAAFISRAILWQNIFRFCFMITVISVGGRIYFIARIRC